VQAVHGGSGERLGARHHGQWTPLARALDVTGNHWTLLIALALVHGAQRPVQLQRRIAGISGAVLDRHVQQMVAAGLLSRTRHREMPPRVELALTDAGRELLPIAGALARWGMRHMWSAPGPRERTEAVALIELLPALLEGAEGLPDSDSLELVVQDQPQDPVRRWFAIEHGALRALARSDTEPQTTASGDTEAWVAALGPGRDPTGLRIRGREALVRAVLAALPALPAP
jgi:DNA-binding HxlR family transcriptional regulator